MTPFQHPRVMLRIRGVMGGEGEVMPVFPGNRRRGRRCSPPVSWGRQRVGPKGATYHTLATGTDTVEVPVAAASPIMDHLVHEDHIPCVL